MNSTFAYVVWGIYPKEDGYKNNHWYARRQKIDNDILLYLANPYSPPSIVYVFGSENYTRLSDLGLTCKLIDPRPFVANMEKEQYIMKIIAWDYALMEFESVIFMDFDTITLRPIPIDFWNFMNQGEPIRSAIFQYHLKRINRIGDHRKLSSASFVYIKGKKHTENMLRLWEDMGRPWKEELVLSAYIDSFDGGWQGCKNYAKYDVPYYEMTKIPDLPKDPNQLIFAHFNHHFVSALLGDGKDVKNRIDAMARRIFL